MGIDGAAEYAEAKRLVTTEPEQAKVHALLALTAAVLELRQAVATTAVLQADGSSNDD